MKPVRLSVNGLKLHERFSQEVLAALDRMEKATAALVEPHPRPKFRRAERQVLRTLYHVTFASGPSSS